jgi:hypothetical protein
VILLPAGVAWYFVLRLISKWPIRVLLLLPAGSAMGQVASQAQLDRFERQLERTQRESRVLVDPSISAGERALVDYGGYLSASLFSIDDPVGENHVLRQYELVGYGRVNFDGAHELFVRANTTYFDFNHGDDFDGDGDDWQQPKIERAHYRFDLQRALAAYHGEVIEGNIVAQVGRQLVRWGNGVTLDEEIDGGAIRLSNGRANLDLLAGITYNNIVDFDTSRPDFRRDTARGLFGAMLSVQAGTHQPYVYGLVQRDYNGGEVLTTDGVATRFSYDSHYIGIGSTGAFTDNWLYGVEAVYEGGHGLSNSFDAGFAQVDQTDEDIEAFALDARLEYLLADPRRTRISAELILATGDRDRLSSASTFGGNESGTDDHGFNAFGLLNTGLAFAPTVSNLAMVRFGVATFPVPESTTFRNLQAGFDVLVFNKFEGDAPIDEPTNNRQFLGVEGDLYITWQITSDVTFVARYGGFIPGPAIEGDSGLRNLFFTGVTYAF